ncbi:MFS transporter [Intrasporangium oryzae]|uniref:MFS transporter n=1 Tax=Intrasporangium oryzae TaxID=412687 RepID=UPI00054D8F46|nr:MFS transporter [Intrasporangium oryzae]
MTTSTAPAVQPETDQTGGLLSTAHRATTIGIFALVSLHAFESLALTTVMPTIAKDLDGASLYAMAFTATLAAGIVSVVWSGNLADRRGPRLPLLIGLLLFALGLVGAGLAPTMPVLVATRVVQGLGAGMTSTALYVLVTRVYPARLHTAVFAGFAAAWVVPSVVGPFVAGLITQSLGWRWVFGLSLLVLVVAAGLLGRILPALRQPLAAVPWRRRAIVASVTLAVAVLVLNAAAGEAGTGAILSAAAATVVLVASLRPLLPRGTLTARRGLPTDVTVRGLSFAAFAGAEIYLPRLLTERDGFPPALAGLSLTATGVTWFVGSSIQGRWSSRFEIGRTVRFGLAVEAVALAALAIGVALDAPAWVLIALFPLVGFGIGTLAPRVTTQALGRADDDNQGFVSSALQIGDSAGAATALSTTAILFAVAGSVVPGAYVVVFAAAAVPALLGWLIALRVR